MPARAIAHARFCAVLSLCLVAACGETASTGTLDVLLAAEDTVTEGLAAGTGDEDVVDGWSVSFERYIVVVSDVEVAGGAAAELHDADAIAVDLTALDEAGLSIARFESAPAGAWPEVGFSTPAADADTMRHASVSEADLARMIAGGCTYLIVGELTNAAGQRCLGGDSTMCSAASTIAFDLCVPAATVFGPCESDTGIEGLTIAAGATTTVNFTIHGDHLFFNGFPEGAEGSVARRAQWMANADVDADGTVTQADLESIGASDLGQLLPSDLGDGRPGFALGGAPMIDGHGLESAWDYVRAQLKTQGHFQGEGECPWDGTAHAH